MWVSNLFSFVTVTLAHHKDIAFGSSNRIPFSMLHITYRDKNNGRNYIIK